MLKMHKLGLAFPDCLVMLVQVFLDKQVKIASILVLSGVFFAGAEPKKQPKKQWVVTELITGYCLRVCSVRLVPVLVLWLLFLTRC